MQYNFCKGLEAVCGKWIQYIKKTLKNHLKRK